MAETAAEKSAREAKEKEEKANAAQTSQESKDTPPRGDAPATPAGKEEEMSTREKEATGSPDPDVLTMVLSQNQAPPPEVRTYDQNRFKVGEGHSMMDRYVQGEEIDMEELVRGLGKDRAEQAYHLRRLLTLGAVVRMADQEPLGGTATGPLQPLMSSQARRMDTSNEVRMVLGQDLQDRVAGMSTEEEMQRSEQRWQQEAHARAR